MPLSIERGSGGTGIQIVRTVVDTIDACNLRCNYCDNFNPVNKDNVLPPSTIEGVLRAADTQNQLDVVLSGGEITTHPEFEDLIHTTHILENTGTTLITNGTLLDTEKVRQIRTSNISRVCLSLDGPNAASHKLGRGATFERALWGLYLLQESGKNITVLTVLHKANIDQALKLSEFLAAKKLAQQHHFAAMYFSGRARDNWDKFKLSIEQIYGIQSQIDRVFDEFQQEGLYLTFNHYWPLTGERSKAGNPREMLSHTLGEQNKATWVVVRSNGDVNATTMYWGRQSVVNPVVGNLESEPAATLFQRVDETYRTSRLFQLPREQEAKLKYVVGDFDALAAEAAVRGDIDTQNITLVPCRPMSDLDVMQKPIEPRYLNLMAQNYLSAPSEYRIVQHVTGVFLFYQNTTGHVILLNEGELNNLRERIDHFQSTKTSTISI